MRLRHRAISAVVRKSFENQFAITAHATKEDVGTRHAQHLTGCEVRKDICRLLADSQSEYRCCLVLMDHVLCKYEISQVQFLDLCLHV